MVTPPPQSHEPELRRRADRLLRLAADVDLGIASLVDALDSLDRSGERRRRLLADALLERSLHQLHRSADGLRSTALAFRRRADELAAPSQSAA